MARVRRNTLATLEGILSMLLFLTGSFWTVLNADGVHLTQTWYHKLSLYCVLLLNIGHGITTDTENMSIQNPLRVRFNSDVII